MPIDTPIVKATFATAKVEDVQRVGQHEIHLKLRLVDPGMGTVMPADWHADAVKTVKGTASSNEHGDIIVDLVIGDEEATVARLEAIAQDKAAAEAKAAEEAKVASEKVAEEAAAKAEAEAKAVRDAIVERSAQLIADKVAPKAPEAV